MDTQLKILQKAKELFMHMGIRSVSMDDIATQTGISKKTIYQYYVDKDELVDAVMKEEEESIHQDSKECLALSKNAVEEILLTLSRVYTRFSQMNPLVISDMERFHTKAHLRFQQMKYEHLYNVIQKNIKRGIKEGLYRKELNLEVITKYRLESIMIPFNLKVYPPSKFSLAEVTKELMEHFLIGLSTLKGHELIQQYKEQKIKIA
jgi:AcrR family transcriptional regulator